MSSESAALSAAYDPPERAQEKTARVQRFVFAVLAVTVFQHFRCPAAMPDISVEPFFDETCLSFGEGGFDDTN